MSVQGSPSELLGKWRAEAHSRNLQILQRLRWWSHPDFKITLHTLQYISTSRPRSGVLENVCGFAAECGGASSPLTMVIQKLKNFGYEAGHIHMQLGDWHQASRHRRASVACAFSQSTQCKVRTRVWEAMCSKERKDRSCMQGPQIQKKRFSG